MEKLRKTTLFLYRHHFVRYLAVGGTTFIIDVGLLFVLHGKAKVNVAIAASISYWVSVIYNFMLNRYWTFDAREKESLRRHITIYSLLLILNYTFVVIVVSLASRHYILAKVIAVLIQMVWTYPVYKKVIFVPSSAAL